MIAAPGNHHPIAAAAGALALGTVLAACGAGAQPITASGTLQVTDSNPPPDSSGCDYAADDGFADIAQGTQVTVSAGGRVLAVGQLQFGTDPGNTGTCSFAFAVRGVPGGHALYGVEVSHRGTLYYSAAQLQGGIMMTLGD
jgi:hypothetical protein